MNHLQRRSKTWKRVIIGLVALTVLVAMFSVGIGYVPIPFEKVVRILTSRIVASGTLGENGFTPIEQTIIMEIRLPRVLASLLVGSGLAVAGAVFQGIFRNPMADPYVIGVSSGAALGAALAIILKLSYSVVGLSAVSGMAFLGALGAVFLTYNIARIGDKIPVMTLLLAGIGVSIFLSAIVALMEVAAGFELKALILWLMGGFSTVEWRNVITIAPLSLLSIVFIVILARDLNLVAMGEEDAQHLGLNVERSKKIFMIFASLVTAMAVSVSGLIGFVGLVVPHLTRIMVGPDHRILIPSSCLLGAVFLTVCDSASRTVIAPVDLPVGIITALSGGPFFVYLLRKKKGTYTM